MTLRLKENALMLHEWGRWARSGEQRLGIKPHSWALLYRSGWNETPRNTRVDIDDDLGLKIDEAIAEAPEQVRSTAVLYYVYGLSERQIARALRIPRRQVTRRREHVVSLVEKKFYWL